jgi:hypothetical protein
MGARAQATALLAACLLAAASAGAVGGCHHPRPIKTPGETDLKVRAVEVMRADGGQPSLNIKPLLQRLGQRAGGVVYPDRYYNPFQVAEDRLRVQSYWRSLGFLEAEVSEPRVTFHADQTVTIRWEVAEGEPALVGEVGLRGAPPQHEATLWALIPQRTGDAVDLELYRRARIPMADTLRRAGFGHAMVYSRAFIDAERRLVHWFYDVDAGPLTEVGEVAVDGSARVSPADIIGRSGLRAGAPLGMRERENAALDLLDTGSFASALVQDDADVELLVGKTPPDTGGELRPSQVDADGQLVPRALPAALSALISVVEAPAVQVEVEAGGGVDPGRWDVGAGATLWWRDVGAAFQHLVLEGSMGYGGWWSAPHVGSGQDPSLEGLYGEGLARWVGGGWFGRVGDGRVTARYRSALLPGYRLDELTAGPGARVTFARWQGWGAFGELDLLYRRGQARGLGDVAEADAARLSWAQAEVSQGAQALARLILDGRDDPVEARAGLYGALTLDWSPGGPLGTHRWARVGIDGRWMLPLGAAWALALKADARWVLGADDAAGVPLGPRLFGGGAFGVRGEGRGLLSPLAQVCAASGCGEVPLGGLSLWESSVEARWLPFRLPYGAAFFADIGGVGPGLNPWAEGATVAVGAGLRVRLWHLPIALDLSYAPLRRGQLTDPGDWGTYGAFVRMGEAF